MKVTLRLDHQVQFGEHHALIGSAECVGSWQNRVEMRWTDSGWVADLEANPGEKIEYKYIVVAGDGNLVWENGPNRTLQVPNDSGAYQLVSHWDNTGEEVQFVGASNGNGSASKSQESTDQNQQNGSAKVEEKPAMETSSSFVQGWQGKEINFMRSNEHSSREQSGKWDTTGLQGPAKHIVDGDRGAANWWRKVLDTGSSMIERTNNLFLELIS